MGPQMIIYKNYPPQKSTYLYLIADYSMSVSQSVSTLVHRGAETVTQGGGWPMRLLFETNLIDFLEGLLY